MHRILFFSSDARDLYKRDIFECMALPVGYKVRFRYLVKYLYSDESFGGAEEELHTRLATKVAMLSKRFDSFVGRDATIVFTSGNNPENDGSALDLECIRKATVTSVSYEQDLEQFNFVLELQEFESGLIKLEPRMLPPRTWVSECDLINCKERSWIETIDKVKKHFQETTFMYLQKLVEVRKRKEVPLAYSKQLQRSFYSLDADMQYVLHAVFYDPDGHLKISSRTGTEQLSVTHPTEIGAIRDCVSIGIETGVVERRSIQSSTILRGNDRFFVTIDWSIKNSIWRSVLFGVVSAIGASGALLIFLARSDLNKTAFSLVNSICALIGVILIGLSAALLYRFFYKT